MPRAADCQDLGPAWSAKGSHPQSRRHLRLLNSRYSSIVEYLISQPRISCRWYLCSMEPMSELLISSISIPDVISECEDGMPDLMSSRMKVKCRISFPDLVPARPSRAVHRCIRMYKVQDYVRMGNHGNHDCGHSPNNEYRYSHAAGVIYSWGQSVQ